MRKDILKPLLFILIIASCNSIDPISDNPDSDNNNIDTTKNDNHSHEKQIPFPNWRQIKCNSVMVIGHWPAEKMILWFDRCTFSFKPNIK